MPTTAPALGDDANPLLELVDAATQRLQTAEPVAASKWKTGGSIEDPQRVEQVLGAVSADATGKDVDADYVRRIFTDQIDATEAIEYTRFAQWKLDPGSAPGVAPDLSASRAIIDRLNAEMVEQVAVHWSVLHSPDCTGTLDDAKTAIADVTRRWIPCISRRFRSPRIRIASDRRSHEASLVADVVLGDRGGTDRSTLLVAGTAAAECLDRGLRFPPLEDVDAARLEQVGRQREVQAARGAARLAHHLDASRQVVVAVVQGRPRRVRRQSPLRVSFVCSNELSPDMTAFRVGNHRRSPGGSKQEP